MRIFWIAVTCIRCQSQGQDINKRNILQILPMFSCPWQQCINQIVISLSTGFTDYLLPLVCFRSAIEMLEAELRESMSSLDWSSAEIGYSTQQGTAAHELTKQEIDIVSTCLLVLCLAELHSTRVRNCFKQFTCLI